jgi:hypothetical protein
MIYLFKGGDSMWVAKELTGMRFGKLTVLDRAQNDKRGQSMWNCLCDCGKATVVNGYYLTTEHTRSCGCVKKSMGGRNKTHGQSNTALYRVWSTMKRRCHAPTNQKYKNYGARGIKVCAEWKKDFSEFYRWATKNGFQRGLTIDRIDVNGDYCPENCKWSTLIEQAQNKTNNRNIEFCGKTMSISSWERETGICRKTISDRLYKGWSVGEALTKPIKSHKKYGTF